MNLTTHERPGVYSSYDASTLVRGSGGHKTVGLAAINSTASAGVPITVTSYEAAVAAFGSQEGKQDMAELIRIALLNGAAAVAGAIAAQSDPAIPLGGAELLGLKGLSAQYSDNDIDLLVRGGVTALESVSGQVGVVRGVTTRTSSGEVEDTTWRELSTILIVDDVIPTLRDSLRSKFRRAKNTAQSRGAIRTQVVLELENKKSREIITDYDQVTVSAHPDDPTVCLVDFTFTVTHGLNQIWLTAHIVI